MEVPIFIDKFKSLQKPFNESGKPSDFLKLLVPFVESDRMRKPDIYRRVNIGEGEKGKYNKMLWRLSSANILETIPRGDGIWKQGKNFMEYLHFVFGHIMDNPHKKDYVGDLFHIYDNNIHDMMFKKGLTNRA